MHPIRFAATAIAAACLAGAAVAGPTTSTTADATVLIDQAKALAGSATPNDPAGFPVVISKPGSYRLAGNLVVPAGMDGILVTSSDVTLDLNGFSITGAAGCGGTAGSVSCNDIVSTGVKVWGDNLRRVAVANGMIGGFGTCLRATTYSRVSELDLHDCNSGLVAFDGSLVARVSINMSRFAATVYGSVVQDMTIGMATVGVSTTTSVFTRLNVMLADQAIANTNGHGPSSVRESVLGARLPITGMVTSMGGNLCNGSSC